MICNCGREVEERYSRGVLVRMEKINYTDDNAPVKNQSFYKLHDC